MAKFRLGDFCCQGGDRVVDSSCFSDSDLVLLQRGKSTLLFSPLGNDPEHPVLALVGITPGGQSEVFARLLRSKSVKEAALNAAFASGQGAIKKLLSAHDFAKHIGIDLTGDLNYNPKILTTSLVKCCMKVDGSYKYKAPDIEASPEASYCVKNRFVADIEKYSSIKWVIVFGDAGWEAVNAIKHQGMSVKSYLESKGRKVLNFPHFAQNFQQRAIFCNSPFNDIDYIQKNPSHEKYFPGALRMRSAVIEFVTHGTAYETEMAKSSSEIKEDQSGGKREVNMFQDSHELFCMKFFLLHENGDKLYPVRVKNRETGDLAFRISAGGTNGNTKSAGIEIEDEMEMKRYVVDHGFAVRASTLNRSRKGLFKIGQRAILRAVEVERSSGDPAPSDF